MMPIYSFIPFVNVKQNPLKKVIFVFGCPGVGKTTFCKQLENKYDNFLHLSTQKIPPKIEKENSVSNCNELETKMNNGEYVQCDVVMLFLKKIIETTNKEYIILEGFPTTKDNIDSWKQVLGKITKVVGIFYLFCTNDTIKYRLMNRVTKKDHDTLDNIKKIIDKFNSETLPLIHIFEEKKIPIMKIYTENKEHCCLLGIQEDLKKYKFIK